jgi:hypothetical protein
MAIVPVAETRVRKSSAAARHRGKPRGACRKARSAEPAAAHGCKTAAAKAAAAESTTTEATMETAETSTVKSAAATVAAARQRGIRRIRGECRRSGNADHDFSEHGSIPPEM